MDWPQSVKPNLHSTGLENNLENGAGKKSTQTYLINTSLARWRAPESFHAVAEDSIPSGRKQTGACTRLPCHLLLGMLLLNGFPPTPSPTPERHPLSSWALVQAWPRRWPDSCCFTASTGPFPSGSSESTAADDFLPCSHRFFACPSLSPPLWCSPPTPGSFHLGSHTYPVVVACQACHSWCYSGTSCVLPPGPYWVCPGI